MTRFLASLVAFVLLVSPAAKALAGCCPEMAHAAMEMAQNTLPEAPPCHADAGMSMGEPTAEAPAISDHATSCGHAVDCCGAVAALVVDLHPLLVIGLADVRAPQPEYAPLTKHPETLLRPPSIC